MSTIWITLLQGFQLAALGPSLFAIAFLLLVAKDWRRGLVPALYFAALSASFLLPLLAIFESPSGPSWLVGTLLFLESTAPAFTFLLIVQLVFGRWPPPLYWLVLAVPLLGGGLLLYGDLTGSEWCLRQHSCMPAATVKTFYSVFGSALLFLLLMLEFGRGTGLAREDAHRTHKYWIIVSLVMLNLILLGVDIALLAQRISADQAEWMRVVVRIGFIYLVLTSLFRVFDTAVPIDMARLPTAVKALMSEQDRAALERIETAMEKEKFYRQMGLSREDLAKHIGISVHQLSRLLNTYLGKSFSEFVNSYRVKEAKERLSKETTQVTVIAFETGFNSIASFNRVFKDMAGCSPTEWRQKETI